MNPRNYVILMVAGIAMMVLIPVAPCGAEWQHVYSYVPNNPNWGRNTDWSTYYEEFSFSSGTTADSGGVSASGSCNAWTWTDAYASQSGPTDMSRSASASCSTYGSSYYIDPDPPNWLYVSWSVSGGGSVYCSGNVDDDYCTGSTDASSSADGGTDADDGYGYGSAWGSAWTRDEPGSAGVSWGGDAEEGSSSVSEPYGGYEASLSFSVEGSDSWADDSLTSFSASASVWAGSSSYASASVTQGVAYASSRSDGHFSGSSSTSVSY
jgi:hypothetical protein